MSSTVYSDDSHILDAFHGPSEQIMKYTYICWTYEYTCTHTYMYYVYVYTHI
jgi:hypothetical protein